MRTLESVGAADVQSVYAGAECDLWELLMGSQIHIGGMRSSQALADAAGIAPGSRGVDLCCCKGAGMEFLVRFRGAAAMTGVDFTATIIRIAEQRASGAGLSDRLRFVLADAEQTGLPAGEFDFAWGEDAWCYVPDKRRLVREAARLVRPGGTLAFTDWVEGTVPLSAEEARRFMAFMKFPSLACTPDYRELLESAGLQVQYAGDTGRFAPCLDLYVAMVQDQLTFDALRIVNFDAAVLEGIGTELSFVRRLAHEGKLAQAMFVARR
jgi:ubiquinone/menaquinone biosynthesis C-methylase UbiE